MPQQVDLPAKMRITDELPQQIIDLYNMPLDEIHQYVVDNVTDLQTARSLLGYVTMAVVKLMRERNG